MNRIPHILLWCMINCLPAIGQEVTLLAGGDVEWSRNINAPKYYFGAKDQSKKIREDGWRKLPLLANEQSKNLLINSYGVDPNAPNKHHIKSIPLGLKFNSVKEENDYPFFGINKVLKEADFTFLNLETPISDTARQTGAFRTPLAFATALADNGVDIVSTANNHAFDAGSQGIWETKKTLTDHGIKVVGTGKDLADARKPVIVEKNGIKLAFLAYTYGVNPTNYDYGFALPDRSGAMPLDPFLIKEDIKMVRSHADFVILSFHWGLENKQEIHPAAIDFAHQMIDEGADVILGHHPHVIRGIEVYKGKPIIYSLGNFIFGHTHDTWKDNFLARIVFEKSEIAKVEIIPIAGKMKDVGQPYVLEGARAKSVLKDVKKLSGVLNTKILMRGNIGVIHLMRSK